MLAEEIELARKLGSALEGGDRSPFACPDESDDEDLILDHALLHRLHLAVSSGIDEVEPSVLGAIHGTVVDEMRRRRIRHAPIDPLDVSFPLSFRRIEKSIRAMFGSPGGKRFQAPMIGRALLTQKFEKYIEPFCFPTGTEIRCRDGWKPIEDIRVGQEVLAPTDHRVVLGVVKRQYDGPLREFRVRGDFRALRCTPEHSLLAIKSQALFEVRAAWGRASCAPFESRAGYGGLAVDHRHSQPRLSLWRARELLKLARWIPAADIQPGDWLVQHFSDRSIDKKTIELPFARFGGCKRDRKLQSKCDLAACRLVGLYLAEGCFDRRSVHFSFHECETELIDFVRAQMLDRFGTAGRVQVREGSHGVAVRLSTVQGARFFAQFGQGAKNKLVPEFWKSLPDGHIEQIIRGLFEGDGYCGDDGPSLTTVSSSLAQDAFDLLVRLGCLPSISKHSQLTCLPGAMKARRECHSFRVSLFGQGRERVARLLGRVMDRSTQHVLGMNLLGCGEGRTTRALLRKIRSATNLPPASVEVFNLEVEEDHAYVTRLSTVHNCGGAALFWWMPKREEVKEVLNDVDPEIAHALQFVRDASDAQFAEVLRQEWTAKRSLYEKLQKEKASGDLRRFYRFLYLKRFSYGAVKCGLERATFDPTSSGRVVDLQASLPRWRDRLKGVAISCADWRECIRRHDDKDAMFYMDPPYPNAGTQPFAQDPPSLKLLREHTKSIKGKWALSIEDTPDARKEFEKAEIRGYARPKKMDIGGATEGTPLARELLIANFALPGRLCKDGTEPDKNEDLRGLDSATLLSHHAVLHAWYDSGRHEGWTREEVANLHARIVEEMAHRGVRHPAASGSLDADSKPLETAKFDSATVHPSGVRRGPKLELAATLAPLQSDIPLIEDFVCVSASGSGVDVLVRSSFELPEALKHVISWRMMRAVPEQARRARMTFHFADEEVSGEPLYDLVLERTNAGNEVFEMSAGSEEGSDAEVDPALGLGEALAMLKQFRVRKDYVSVVGGLAIHGSTEGDVDILVRDSPEMSTAFTGLLEARLLAALPREAAGRAEFHYDYDEFFGPFTDHVPLFHLALLRAGGVRKALKRGTGPWREAQKSMREDRVAPMRMLHLSKPIKPAFPGSRQTVEAFVAIVSAEGKFPVAVQKKYDGVHCLLMRRGGAVRIVTEDGEDVTDRLPGMVEAVRSLPLAVVTLDAEVESWEGGKHLPREMTSGYLSGKEPPDDSRVVANVFDVLYAEGELLSRPVTQVAEEDQPAEGAEGSKAHAPLPVRGDLHGLPMSGRLRVLSGIGLRQSTTGAPDPRLKLNLAPTVVARSEAELVDAVRELRFKVGSEGAVAKWLDRPYPLTGRARISVKFHNSVAMVGAVIRRVETKTPGTFNYYYGLLPGTAPIAEDQLVEVGGVPLVEVGKTFNTEEVLVPGDLLEVEVETFNFVERVDGSAEVSGWVPRVIGAVRDRKMADTVQDVRQRARAEHVLEEKVRAAGGETVVLSREHFGEIAARAPDVGPLPVLKMPDPEFLVARMREGKRAGLLSRVDRAGRVGAHQLLVSEAKGGESGSRAYGVVTIGPGVGFASWAAVPPDVREALDAATRAEFEGEKDFFFHPVEAVRIFDAPVPLRRSPPGRRFGSVVDLREEAAAKDAEIALDPAGAVEVAGDDGARSSLGGLQPEVISKQEDQYLAYPDEGETYHFVAQNHHRGRSVHWDLRMENLRKEFLIGWTINSQGPPGAIGEPVLTLAQARAVAGDPRALKVNVKTGEWAQRLKRGARELVNVELLAERKARQPLAWLRLDGATEPGAIGGTRNFPGVFLIWDRGTVEYGCFPGGELVLTEHGAKPIELVQKGERLCVGRSGHAVEVRETFEKPFQGKLYRFFPRFAPSFTVTGNHPVLVLKRGEAPYLTRITGQPNWVRADSVAEGDVVFIPRPVATSTTVRLFSHLRAVEVDEEIAWLLGLFVGDGCAQDLNYSMTLALSERVTIDHAVKVLARLGLDAHCYPCPGHTRVQVYSREWEPVFRDLFYAEDKRKMVPPALLHAPDTIIRAFLHGLWDADGDTCSRTQYRLKSTSEHVVYALHLLFARLGLAVCNSRSVNVGGRSPYAYSASWSKRLLNIGQEELPERQRKNRQPVIVGQDSIGVPVKRIEVFDYEGPVYNLETEDNTIPMPVLTHNSQKNWMHEYFLRGGVLDYRIFFRMLRLSFKEKAARDLAESLVRSLDSSLLQSGNLEGIVLKQLEHFFPGDEISKVVVLEASEQPFLEGEPAWFCIKPIDQTPHAVSARAVEDKWVPPPSVSALPAEVRRKVPQVYRYWEQREGGRRLQVRDALVVAMRAGEVKLPLVGAGEPESKSAIGRFALQYHFFRGPTIVREGPSRFHYDLRADFGGGRLWRWRFELDPLDQPASSGQFDSEEDPKLIEAAGFYPPGSGELNPTKETPAFIERVDSGDAVLLVDQPGFKKVLFRGKRLSGTWTFARRDAEWQVERSAEVAEVKVA